MYRFSRGGRGEKEGEEGGVEEVMESRGRDGGRRGRRAEIWKEERE